MFGSEATRFARIDWAKYGAAELQSIGDLSPEKLPQAVEQLQRALQGAFTGLRQLSEEFASALGNRDTALLHTGPITLTGYEPDAPGVSNDEEREEQFHARIATLAHDSVWDDTAGMATGGLAGLSRGVWIFHPAINNPVVAGGAAINKIVLVGGLGAGIKFDNIFTTNIYNLDGTVWSALPAGSVIMWSGAIGSIPSGWALMDGTSNASGSGIDMRGMVPYGYSGAGDFATVGASVAIALTVALADGSGGSSVALTHTETDAGFVTTQGHSHEDNTVLFAQFDPVSGTNAVINIQGRTSDGTFSTTSATDTVLKSVIAAALEDHSFTYSSVASNITVGTPSVLRPAGKVLAYIEKLP